MINIERLPQRSGVLLLSGLGRVFTQGGGKKPTVVVGRRRQGTSGGPQSGRRAEAPRRDRPRPGSTGGGGGGGGFTGGGSSGGSGGGIGGLGGGGLSGGTRLPIGLVILIIVGYFLYSLFTGGGDQSTGVPSGSDDLPPLSQSTPLRPAEDRPLPTADLGPTPTRRPTSASTGDTTWTVMLYQDADDQVLEQDIYIDLNEVEKIGSSDRVSIVAQVDRYQGAYQADGNWTGTRRYYIEQDDDLTRVGSRLVEELGEENMASGDTLVDFIAWAAANYPADRYALILSDHGTGWPGGWSDPDPGGRDGSRVPIASALDDNLFLMEIDAALADARSAAGIERFELIGMDACLMAHLEVFAALEPHANYAVASQETEPALGWAYASFLQALVDNPNLNGADLGEAIVASYITEDQRIVDANARADYLRQGSPLGGLFGGAGAMSAEQLASQLGRDITLTAVDLAAFPDLMASVNAFAVDLQDVEVARVSSARNYAQSFTNIFSRGGPSPYIDLGHFTQLVAREGGSQPATQSASAVLNALQAFVVAERHGPGKPGATGVSLYFPNSTLYSSPVAGPQSYTGVAERFARTSLWDDYLAFFYHDTPIRPDQNAIAAPQGNISRAPGAGEIEIANLALSSDTAAPNDPVRLTADITGENIGYIYFFLGYYDQAANSIWVGDTDYLESSETRELNGVYYPVWPQGETFTLALDWEPTVFEIQNGDQRVVALFTPQQYGSTAEETVYTVDGIYHYANGESLPARLHFQDGAMRRVFGYSQSEGFTGEEAAGAPWEITPAAGDSFTVAEKWLDLGDSGQVEATTYEEGETLVFGGDTFRLGEVFAAEGSYILGLIVEDLDGNQQQAYAPVTVR